MRLSWPSGRVGVLFSFGALIILMVNFSLNKYKVKVNELQEQMLLIRDRYNKMTGNDVKEPQVCKPIHKIAFAKTHKTGSSTLQNILFRFGDLNDLNFAMPDRSWMFSFKEPFNSTDVLSLPTAKLGYDIFAFHSIWVYEEVKKVLPTALYITLLRDPVDCFESNYVYMGLQNAYGMDINEYAEKKASLNPVRRATSIIGKNQMLWDLGMTWFEMENLTIVEQKIAQMDSQFNLVLLAEHFDESLVILANLLCWDLETVRYLKQNARKADNKTEITAESRAILKEWLKGDYILYDHFKAKFELEIEKYGRQRLAGEVDTLAGLNEQLTQDCVLEVADNSKLRGEFKMALDIVEGYLIDESKPWCAQFARSEPNFSVQVRKKQLLRAGYVGFQPLNPGIDREKLMLEWLNRRKIIRVQQQ